MQSARTDEHDATRPAGPGARAVPDGDLAAMLAHDELQRRLQDVRRIEQMGFATTGSAYPQVVLLKGALSPLEASTGAILSGADGTALTAALDKLGYPTGERAGVSTCVRPAGDEAWAPADPRDLAWVLEALDPELVIATDDAAATAVAAAWGLAQAPAPGEVAWVRCRRLIALGGFADALGDMQAKQVMWARLKRVPPLGDPL